MTEPIPSASQHADGDAAGEHQLPANAEDRKAAAALSSLNENDISQTGAEGASALPSAADQEALGKAMSRLEIVAGGGGGGAAKKDGGKKIEGAAAKKEEIAVKKKAVKVAPEDVELLVRYPGTEDLLYPPHLLTYPLHRRTLFRC